MSKRLANSLFVISLITSSCGGGAIAQAPPGVGPQSADAAPPIAIKLATHDFAVGGDGLFTETTHVEITASNDAAARSVAQQAFSFSSETEELDVAEAYTLKKEGKKLPVEPSQIFVQSPQNTAQAPMFSDLKLKVVVFPDVSANDTLVFTLTRRQKEAIFPGQFFDAEIYPRLTAWDEVRDSITVPKSLPLSIESHALTTERKFDGDKVVYLWKYSAPTPLSKEVAALAPIDREPRFFASTFKNYDELGHAYAALAAPKAAVTPKIRALADEITAGVSDHRAQAEKIYFWVSKRIRYVAIELGRGRVVPHDADTVVTNGYGDCKDHVVAFAALLQAKGIRSEMALISGGNSYTLSDAPTLAQLNHVITWLPDFKIYADTTAVAPFGTLPFFEYGKPVVHAVDKGPTRHTTPLLTPGEATMSLKTVSRLGADGTLRAESTTTATGPFAIMLRQVGTAVEAAGSQRAIQAMLQRAGLAGTGSFDLPSATSDLGPSYSIAAHFEAQPRVPYTTGQGFPMPPGLRLLPFAGDYLMGPLYTQNLPVSEPTPCWTGTAVEELSLEAPPGKHFTQLPPDVSVATPNLTFSAHWSRSEQTVTVRREFTSKITQELCTGAIRQATADALAKIAAVYPIQITLAGD
jgi:transglutaminase-like putative cysteine protease